MEYPTVSVLTPTYNRKNFIELCIFNLKNQTYPLDKLEWFVLDDSNEPYTKKEQEEQALRNNSNKTKGEKYLMENESKKGVTTLASGLQYEVVEMGEGEKPNLDSTVVVHYRGTLIDGTEFDSSYARGEPIEFKLNQVIQGWQEVLQLMPIGSKWKATIPSDLAYGERGAGSTIGPNSTLLFDIELLDIK